MYNDVDHHVDFCRFKHVKPFTFIHFRGVARPYTNCSFSFCDQKYIGIQCLACTINFPSHSLATGTDGDECGRRRT